MDIIFFILVNLNIIYVVFVGENRQYNSTYHRTPSLKLRAAI